ncbi:MAG TPA: CDP-alcohol phosphatidyltransferase family protein [Thermoanaerobaculia bacterium]|nr:CDP-alcohol phosphatidyltransferase family protein [Thermoanaerobaculia bacterium]
MFTIPNILTFGRLLLVPCFLFASIRGMYAAAFAIFVTAAVTDVFDGMIARRLNQRSRLGALLDPAADKMLLVCGFLFYTFHRMPLVRIPGWLTFVVFIRDFLIVSYAYLMYTRVQVKRFPPSWAGKASTVTQAVTLAVMIAANAFMPGWLAFSELLFRFTLVITLFSAWDYLRRGGRLLDESLKYNSPA